MSPMIDGKDATAYLAMLNALPERPGLDCEPNQEWIDDRAEARFHPEPYVGTDADYYAERAAG